MPKFTHLHLHTHYSLLDGLTKPSDLIARVKELGMDSVAVTDHGNMYGAIEFYQEAIRGGIKPIIGCEVYVADDMLARNPKDEIYHLVLLAKNKTGYNNLMKLVTDANLKGFYYKPRIDHKLLEKYSEGLVCLSGCLSGEVSHALLDNNDKKAVEVAEWYKSIFGDDYYIEVQRHSNNDDQKAVTPRLISLAQRLGIKMVATCDSHYVHKEDNEVHDVLLAVQTGREIGDPDRMTMKDDDFSIISPEEMAELFRDIPEAIENTQEVADKCNLELKLGETHLPEFDLPEGQTADEHLWMLVWDGMRDLKLDENKDYIERLEYETDVIKKTGFAAYLLIVADLINWAKRNHIAVGPGRGSAAGSLLCYLMNITDVDPLKYGLLFERFMNPDRISMPDIDIDIDEEHRDRVIAYVKGKYGDDSVAQIVTFGTMAGRGSIRDAGRAMGYDVSTADMIAKLVPQGKSIQDALDSVDELADLYENKEYKKLIDTAMRLEGTVRHASIHACGIVIAKDKINKYTPTQFSTRDDNSIITQYDMYSVDALGLLKIDLLGLMNLTAIRKASERINERYGNFDINRIPFDDKRTFVLFQRADTDSVFQLESGGMKRYLKDLKPTELNDITAMISLYRPGPMELIPEYIDRKYGRKNIEYLHPSLEPILKETYGIMIYQEQLMACARALAGLTLAEADILRKAVGKKIKKLLDEQEGKFKAGAKRIGTPDHIANKFWELVEPFSRYGFNKSHAVSYAFTAYRTAYLKANYPLEFMEAILNCDATNIERTTYLVNEMDRMGIKMLPPSLKSSQADFSIDGNAIRFGLGAIKGVGEGIMKRLVDERSHGQYESIEDLLIRNTDKTFNRKILEALIMCGAFDEFASRDDLVGNIEHILNYTRVKYPNVVPKLMLGKGEPISDNQKLSWEKDILGLFVSEVPLKKYAQILKSRNLQQINKVDSWHGDFIDIGGMVNDVRSITTKAGKPMLFAEIQDETGKVEVVLFTSSYNKFKDLFKKGNILAINGRIDSRFDKKQVICSRVDVMATMT